MLRTLSWAGITRAGLSNNWKFGSGSFFFSFSSFFSASSYGGKNIYSPIKVHFCSTALFNKFTEQLSGAKGS